jgi:uncharacterized membrane protein YebE (DUF533 family)
MPSLEELDALSTKELHDRAFATARQRLDVRFFWNLLRAVPAAEAAAGHIDEAEEDVMRLAERVRDAIHPDTPEEAEAFRPIYIDYLREQDKS